MKLAQVAPLPTHGRYLLIVDGGLRSVVQLHQLLYQPDQDLQLTLVDASTSPTGQRLVRDLARSYGLPLRQTDVNEVAAQTRSKVLGKNKISFDEAEAYARQYGLAWIRTSEAAASDPLDLRRSELQQQQQAADVARDQRLSKLYYQFKSNDGVQIPRFWLATAPWDHAHALLEFVVRQLAANQYIDTKQVGRWLQLAKTAPAGHHHSLPGSLILRIEYDTVAVVLDAGPAAPLPVITLVPQTSLIYGPLRLSYGSYRQSRHQLQLPLGRYQVRSPRPGDRLTTANGQRKLQDIFTDQHVARHQRSHWPIITDQTGTIVWVTTLASAVGLRQTDSGNSLIAEEI